MPNFAERRKYQRCHSLVGKSLASNDENCWQNIGIDDISASGLSFTSVMPFDASRPIYLNIYIYNMLSEFNMRLEGRIIRAYAGENRFYYGVRLENINKHQQVQLDELVRTKVTSDGYYPPLSERYDFEIMLPAHAGSKKY